MDTTENEYLLQLKYACLTNNVKYARHIAFTWHKMYELAHSFAGAAYVSGISRIRYFHCLTLETSITAAQIQPNSHGAGV